jgi:hypothetical protein
VKVGDLVEYYAPQGNPHNPHDICHGHVMEIFPSEGLSIIFDTHLIIDGLHPITYGRPIQLEGEGEWYNTDTCECYVGQQDDRVRRHSRKFKAISDGVKQSFYDSKWLFASSSNKGSKEGGLVCVLVCDVKQTGYKSGPKQDEIALMREDCKRRKEDLDYPMYVPKDGMKKTNTISKKKSAGGSLDVVIFSFN